MLLAGAPYLRETYSNYLLPKQNTASITQSLWQLFLGGGLDGWQGQRLSVFNAGKFSIVRNVQTLGPAESSCKWLPGAFHTEVKWPECEPNHSTLCVV
jgi:hypothetical protein